MTERKPPGVTYETWVERQIREAHGQGEFDHLHGSGRPIADIDRPHDDLWWVKQKLRRERLAWLPRSLALRKEVEDALDAVAAAGSEAEVRRIVEDVNEVIREAIRTPTEGPPVDVVPLDVGRVVERWHAP